MKYVTSIDGRDYEIEIIDENQISVDGELYEIDFQSVADQPVYSLLIDGHSYEAHVYPGDEDWQILFTGSFFLAKVEDERERRLKAAAGGRAAESGEYLLKAPMPGLVVSIPVKEGQSVSKGTVLVVLESMKMQNELRSPREGVVGRMRVKVGESVEQKQTLLNVV
jgi:biotin carboxyl carrier protein